MMDKIKAFFASINGYVIAFLASVAGIISYIFYLRSENKDLSDKVATDKAEAELEPTLDKVKELENESNTKSTDYDTVRDEYLKQQSGSNDTTKS